MRIFPLLLIGGGGLFLLANLGFVPAAELHAVLRTWWPLLPIAVGIVALSRRHSGRHRCRRQAPDDASTAVAEA